MLQLHYDHTNPKLDTWDHTPLRLSGMWEGPPDSKPGSGASTPRSLPSPCKGGRGEGGREWGGGREGGSGGREGGSGGREGGREGREEVGGGREGVGGGREGVGGGGREWGREGGREGGRGGEREGGRREGGREGGEGGREGRREGGGVGREEKASTGLGGLKFQMSVFVGRGFNYL